MRRRQRNVERSIVGNRLAACAAGGFEIVRRRSGGGVVVLRPGELIWIDIVVPAAAHGVPADVRGSMIWAGERWAEALASMEDLEVVFIDTAGKKPGDVQHQEDIGGIIAVANPEDVLLCVSAASVLGALFYLWAGRYVREDIRKSMAA